MDPRGSHLVHSYNHKVFYFADFSTVPACQQFEFRKQLWLIGFRSPSEKGGMLGLYLCCLWILSQKTEESPWQL